MKTYLIIMLFIAPLIGWAQEQPTVTGVVKGSDDTIISGATVAVKGKPISTSTDNDGSYHIAAAPQDTLVYSFVGYQPQQLPVAGKSTIDVFLEPMASDLEEVVVVGYGAVRKSDLTSSITSVKGEDLKDFTAGSALNALQGKANGVQITGSGGPGASPRVIIRGITSVNGSDPLYVVDNVPLPPGTNLNFLNPEDIERMEVLKDASAAAIFGTRASNGVVLITTKKGKSGKTVFTFSGSTGIQTISKPNIADASIYEQVYKTRYTNDDNEPIWNAEDNLKPGDGTDWWKEAVNTTATIHNYNVGFQGGSEKNVFSGNVGYFRQNSQYDVGYWDRLSIRLNNEYTLIEDIKLGIDLAPRYESWTNTPDLYADIMRMDPTTPIFRPTDEWETNVFNNYARSKHNQVWNPMGRLARLDEKIQHFALIMTPHLTVTPIQGMTARTQFNVNARVQNAHKFEPEFFIDNLEQGERSYIERRNDTNIDWNWTNTLSYMFDLDKHHFTTMVGFTMEKFSTYGLLGSRYDVPNSHPDLRYLDAGTDEEKASGTDTYRTLMSVLGRLTYNYDSKYYLTATFRRDGSSAFPAGNRYANFPSISGAWRVSNESFLAGQDIFQDIKLRAGWGRVGNQSVAGPGLYINLIGPADYVFGPEGTRYVGSAVSQVGNPLLTWETVEDVNVGLDLAFLQNKFTVGIDWFRKRNHDMLMQKNNLLVLGYPMWDAQMWANIGSMQAQGWEFALKYSDNSHAFTYDLGLNMTAVQSKAMELAMDAPILTGAVYNDLAIRNIPGEEISRFFGYQIDGVFQNEEQVQQHAGTDGTLIQPNAQPGDFIFRDTNGDGQLNEDDKVFMGKAFPDFTVGFNARLGYKNFDLVANFYGSVGNDIMNLPKVGFYSGENGQNVYADAFDKAWNGEGSTNTFARLSVNDLNNNYRIPSTFMVENGSFLRAKLLQLGYTLPSSMWSNGQLRLSLSAQNLFTITNYTGLDPEVASGGTALESGIDRLGYPNPRTFLLGLNLTF
ncbi:MAG TPA: TonB-dependent receptor [Sphingobacterium sp.]|nr:TonB-dependent receptor [Sphingobacterium sp.]